MPEVQSVFLHDTQIQPLPELKPSARFQDTGKDFFPPCVSKKVIIQKTQFLSGRVIKFFQWACWCCTGAVFVYTETALPKTPPGEETNGILRIKLELFLLFLSFAMFFYHLVIQMIVRCMVFNRFWKYWCFIVKKSSPSINGCFPRQNMFRHKGIRKHF